MNRSYIGLALFLFAVCRSAAVHAVTTDAHVSTGDPLAGSSCTTPATKTVFGPNDDLAYLWVSFKNTVVGDTVEWRWYAPGGSTPYTTASYTTTFAGTGCAWAGIRIKGQAAATLPGQWRVDIYLDGSLAASSNFSIAGATAPLTARAAQLSFSANEQSLVPWSYVDLRYRIKSFQPGLHVDLYLAMRQAAGTSPCPAAENIFTTALPAFASDLALSNTQAVITTGFLPDQLPFVTMTVYGVLVPHGRSPGDPASWVSNLAIMDLAMGPLSSRQSAVLAERGNPDAYTIRFLHDSNRRIETWTYGGGGSGQVFQFINGSLQSTGGGNDRASASLPTPVTAYDPGRFQPGTTPAQLRALIGDPHRVVTKPSGVQVWIFKTSRMTVTIQNGVVRQIAAY